MSRVASDRARVRRLMRLAHLYVGLALSLLLFVLAITGSALVYKEAYWRMVYPELRGGDVHPPAEGHVSAVAAARRAFGDRLRSVKMPEPGVPAYHLYLDGGEAFLAATGPHEVIDTWTPRERLMPFLFDLHAHLMAGENGERVGGVVGLLGAFLVATGLVLWWPARRRLALSSLVPRDLTRRTLLVWHRDLGAVAAPVLLVLLLTGSGMVFYETARALLNGIFGQRPPVAATAFGTADGPPELTPRMLERVRGTFEDARIVFYYPPSPGSAVHGFRLQRTCELHPNGRSYVYLDLAGGVLQTADACASTPGDRATHAIYPLHAGKTGGGAYKLITFLGGLALAILAVTGAVTYFSKLRSGRGIPTGGARDRVSSGSA